jgi:intein-encoded DNA endonuclease-like protein
VGEQGGEAEEVSVLREVVAVVEAEEGKVELGKLAGLSFEERVVKLYSTGIGVEKVAKILGCSAYAVYMTLKRMGFVRSVSEGNKLKYKVYPDLRDRLAEKRCKNIPNLAPSPDLAYVVGALLGDGWITKGRCNRKFWLCQAESRREFVEEFAKAARRIGLRVCLVKVRKRGKEKQDQIWAGGCSAKFVEWFSKLTPQDLEKMFVKREEILAFLRGFYEAEGYVDKRGIVFICNTNKELMDLVYRWIVQLGFHPTMRMYENRGNGGKRPIYLVVLNRRDEARKFLGEITPCIKRGSVGG